MKDSGSISRLEALMTIAVIAIYVLLGSGIHQTFGECIR